uniref:lipase family protein n=1 Tax=Hellea balneolensis TaxID=287478 RepID=UPI00054D629E
NINAFESYDITATDGNDYVYTENGDGDDIIRGLGGSDIIYTRGGNDQIYGGEGDDQLYGGDGDDYIEGGDGNDVLWGEDGLDTIFGGAGNDTIYGGTGADLFVIQRFGGLETISDFEIGIDLVNVFAFSVSEVSSALTEFQNAYDPDLPETHYMHLPTDVSIRFLGIDPQLLSLDDFDFTEVELPADPKEVPSKLLIEFFARQTAYLQRAELDALLRDENPIYENYAVLDALGNDTGYLVEKIFDFEGFLAVALVSDTGQSVLAVRGTASFSDILADLDPGGVGYDQFVAAWNQTDPNSLRQWILDNNEEGIHITGHSLGGAQAQLLTAFASEQQILIGSLTTFNSPGISDVDLSRIDAAYVGNVEHNISSGDVVSMVGDGYVPGQVSIYDLDTITSSSTISALFHVYFAHASHWSDDELYGSDFNVFEQRPIENDPVDRGLLSTSDLGAGTYSHLISNYGFDSEYFSFLVAVNNVVGKINPVLGAGTAAALLTRATAEAARSIIGQAIELISTIADITLAAFNIAIAAGEAVSEWTFEMTDLILTWTAETFLAFARFNVEMWVSAAEWGVATAAAVSSWTSEQWDKAKNWTATTWDAVKDWTSGQWDDAQNWTIEAWETLGDWTASHWEAVKDWTSSQFDDLMGLSADALRDTVELGASLLRRINETGEQITDALISTIVDNPIIIAGTEIIDDIIGGVVSEIFNLGLGDDTVAPGGGFDTASLGAGVDSIVGTSGELDGLRVNDFTDEDSLEIVGIGLTRDSFMYSQGSAILDIDTDGDGLFDVTIKLEGDISFDEIVISIVDGNTVITTSGSSNGIDQDGSDLDDIILGSPGDDVLRGLEGADTLDGAAGKDTASYVGSDERVIITLNSSAEGGHAEGDILSNFESLIGSDFNDILTGDTGDNTLSGEDGNDTVSGVEGNDTLIGGVGNDILDGGLGDDILIGEEGADRLIGGSGADILDGGLGFDSVDYRGAASRVAFDVVSGGTVGDAAGDTFNGIERYYASNFNDTITGSDANEFFYGEDGNDTINAGGGIDRVYGGDGNDIQRGQAGNDQLYGSAGADQLNGGTGFDIANYRAATSAIMVNLATGGTVGDAAGDTYFGLEAIYGSDFNDVMTGSSGTNELRGFKGDDILDGSGGNDRLFGGEGADTLIGGTGIDIAMFTVATAGVTLDLATGGTGGEAAGDSYSGIEWVFGSDFDDDITGDSGANRLTGNDGNDKLNGAGGNDRLLGGDGNDTINGGDGVDTIFGQAGDDIMIGGAGNDFFFGDSGSDSHDGGTGTDTVSYLASSSGVTVNMQTGGTGGDAAGDTYTSIERIFGSGHDDNLTGSDGNDTILGNGGNDFLTGGLGNDSLNGGAGVDSFAYNTAQDAADVIQGLTINEVIDILFTDPAFDTFAEIMAVATDAGANTIFNFGGGNTLTIVGQNIADLSANNFTFTSTTMAEPLGGDDSYTYEMADIELNFFAEIVTGVFDMYALI